LYLILFCVILRHLLSSADFSGLHRSALVLVIAMLGGNAAWNALFFRLGALRLSFLGFLPYGMLVVALTVLIIPIYAFGGVLLSAYCCYLVYAACWSYRLWQLNDPKH